MPGQRIVRRWIGLVAGVFLGGAAAWTAAVPNTAYAAQRTDGPSGFTLPMSAQAGDVIRVTGIGAGGWQVDGLPAGVDWTVGAATLRWSAVASSADELRLLAADDGGALYGSQDGGAGWHPYPSVNPRAWSAVASSIRGTVLAAVVKGGAVYVSTDAGASWVARESSRSWTRNAMSSRGTRMVAAAAPGPICTSVGSRSGATGAVGEFQFAGNGVWQAVRYAMLGDDGGYRWGRCRTCRRRG